MVIGLLIVAALHAPWSWGAGDDAFERLDYPAAVREYEAALGGDSAEAQILWRLARVYVCMAETAEDPERSRFLKDADEYARRCIAADSTCPEGHTWRGAALGYTAFYASLADQVRLAWEVLAETQKALALNPDDDAAYSIRGSLFRAIGGAGWLKRQLARLFLGRLPPGGYEEGEEALIRALTLAPNVMRHHYELAVLYLDWGRLPEAKRALERARECPVRVGIDRPRKVKIGELLQRLEEALR
jgi:tetratricopeptide (TPR) repeat protein